MALEFLSIVKRFSLAPLIFLVFTAFLSGNSPLHASGGESVHLSLEEAVSLALQKGSAVEKAIVKLREEEINYKQGRADLLLNPSILQELTIENSWRVAQRNLEMSKADAAKEVEEAYYDVLRMERALILSEENLERAHKRLEEIETRFSLGMVAEIEILSAELEVSRALSEKSRNENALLLARMSLNRLLGREMTAPLTLVTDLGMDQVILDPVQAVNHALAQRLEIKIAEDTVILREKEVEVNSTDFTPPLVRDRSLVKLAEAKANLVETRQLIEIEVLRNHESLRNAERSIPLQAGSLDIARERFRIDQARFEAGVITSLDLTDSQNRTYEAETAYLQTLFDYSVARANFFKSLGMSLAERESTGPRDEAPTLPADEGGEVDGETE
ncbi:MAG TPA: TolC family protein [Atribacteraceae bacterium]|nr:TolC family protein [Atribacteraceae bacterium]